MLTIYRADSHLLQVVDDDWIFKQGLKRYIGLYMVPGAHSNVHLIEAFSGDIFKRGRGKGLLGLH